MRIVALLLLVFSLGEVYSQNTISGKVFDGNSTEPIIGANIQIKGQFVGTSTDIDGKYSIEVQESDVLIYSFIGYNSQEVAVAGKTTIDINLQPMTQDLGTAVVTALGIAKEKKALAYSVGEVDLESATKARDVNVVNTMQGKVAGVSVGSTSGGAGSSSRIVIRGNSSIVNNNQPLIVIDGVPIDNSTSGTGGTWGGIDYGSPIGDINPDDIESMTVLKGPAASALYGSRALNGVIVITTKTGSYNGNKVSGSFNTNTTFESVNILKEFQNEYGAGTNGQFKFNDQGIPYFETARPTLPTYASSWGPKIDGREYIDWDGETRTYSAYENNYKDFFQVGVTNTNNIGLNFSGKKANARFSASNLNNRGVTPTSKLTRNNLNLNTNWKPIEKLTLRLKTTYIRQNANNRVNQSNGDNVSRNIIMMPRNVSLSSLQNFENEQGEEQTWYTSWGWMANPYFVINRNLNYDDRNRILGNFSASYQVNDWLTIMGRHGGDFYIQNRHNRIAYGSFIDPDGQFSDGRTEFLEQNSDFLVTINKQFNDDWSLLVNAGGNRMHQKREDVTVSANRLNDATDYSIENAQEEDIAERTFLWEKKINSIYGSAQLAFRSYLYLDLTARNDWASTLPKENNSYFYPSVGMAYAFTDHFTDWKTDKLSFGKVRASVAQVGKDAEPYLLQLLYDSVATYNDVNLYSIHNPFPLTDLKPEIKTSYELGTDLRFYQNRIGVDFTWYWESTKNQILTSSVSPASGFSTAIVNAGEIRNSGIELLLNLVPIENEKWRWNSSFNFTKNNNLVVALNELNDRELLGSQWRVDVAAAVGLPYGALFGYGIQKAPDGTPLLNADGSFIRTESQQYFGSAAPDWRLGLSNEFEFGNFSVSFLVDIKKGGKFYSATNMYLHGYSGNVLATLEGREEWYASELAREQAGIEAPYLDGDGNYVMNWSPTGGFEVSGVYADGTIINGQDVSGQATTRLINPEDYWSQYANWTNEIHEPFIYDASFVKLREVILQYSVPIKNENRMKLNDLDISLVGRNLWLIYSAVPNVDPEATYSNGNGQGVEYASYPIVRSIGINLRTSF